MKINTHRDLIVWNSAMDLAMEIFEKTKSFPLEEKYSLTNQIRRSSRSVAANLSEAWRRRRYKAAFISKINDCESEACETQTWIELAFRSGYLSKEESNELDERYEVIIRQLVKMVATSTSWTFKSNR